VGIPLVLGPGHRTKACCRVRALAAVAVVGTAVVGRTNAGPAACSGLPVTLAEVQDLSDLFRFYDRYSHVQPGGLGVPPRAAEWVGRVLQVQAAAGRTGSQQRPSGRRSTKHEAAALTAPPLLPTTSGVARTGSGPARGASA
jgi:hypothetical protein